jgi:hypothetical protein
VNHLPHDLSAGIDGHPIVAGVYEIAVAAPAEESATAFAATPAGSASNRSFSGTQVYFAWRSATDATLPPAAATG